MPHVTNVRHAGVVVSDLKQATNFYMKLLGMKVVKKETLDQYDVLKLIGVVDSNLTYVKLMTPTKNALIELYYFENKEFREQYFSLREKFDFFDFHHISFTVKDIDEMCKKLLRADVDCVSRPSIDTSCKYKLFFCRDYDGNLIELVERIK